MLQERPIRICDISCPSWIVLLERPVRSKQTERCRTTSCDVARNSVSTLFQKHRPVQSIDQSQVSGNIEDQSQVSGNFEEGGGGPKIRK